MYISIVEADRIVVTVGYRNCRKKTTHDNSKTPLRQLRNIVQYVIACMMNTFDIRRSNEAAWPAALRQTDAGCRACHNDDDQYVVARATTVG